MNGYFDQTYPEDDLELLDDDEIFETKDETVSDVDISQTRGHGAQSADGSKDAGWNNISLEPNINLQLDSNDTGPQNIPDFITAKGTAVDFLRLIFENTFWKLRCGHDLPPLGQD